MGCDVVKISFCLTVPGHVTFIHTTAVVENQMILRVMMAMYARKLIHVSPEHVLDQILWSVLHWINVMMLVPVMLQVDVLNLLNLMAHLVTITMYAHKLIHVSPEHVLDQIQ